ncbi:MAG: hemerythrin domain-containing protein [Chloroflexia bacterium]
MKNMDMVAEGTTNPMGEQMVEELKWVHGMIRDNLAIISGMVGRISNGHPAEQVQAEIKDFADTSVIWTLRINCLRYCNFVHGHHGHEDSYFFPGLRKANPDLCPVIDKLEADHREVSDYLDAVEDAANRLRGDEAARVELATALNGLAQHLITHLDYEEANLNPTLRRLMRWPIAH